MRMTSGVPQESVLRPFLFCLYLLALKHDIHSHTVSFHSYVDDRKYLFDSPELNALNDWIQDFKWLVPQNFLQINVDKMMIIVMWLDAFIRLTTTDPRSSSLMLGQYFKKTNKRKLSIICDNDFSLNKQVNSVAQSWKLWFIILYKRTFTSFKDICMYILMSLLSSFKSILKTCGRLWLKRVEWAVYQLKGCEFDDWLLHTTCWSVLEEDA